MRILCIFGHDFRVVRIKDSVAYLRCSHCIEEKEYHFTKSVDIKEIGEDEIPLKWRWNDLIFSIESTFRIFCNEMNTKKIVEYLKEYYDYASLIKIEQEGEYILFKQIWRYTDYSTLDRILKRYQDMKDWREKEVKEIVSSLREGIKILSDFKMINEREIKEKLALTEEVNENKKNNT